MDCSFAINKFLLCVTSSIKVKYLEIDRRSMPLYMSLAGQFGYGRSLAPRFDAIDFGTFSNWHMSNASTIAQTSIPFLYNYDFDGSPSTIADGGFNMWNVGNSISFGTTSNITYGTLASTFYVSQPNVWPQVALGYTTTSGTLVWGNSGNVGMAGSPFGLNAMFCAEKHIFCCEPGNSMAMYADICAELFPNSALSMQMI